MIVLAISITSFFSFWKLDYFSDMNCLKNPLSDMISCSSSTQLITSDFSLSDINLGYIHWTLTPFQSDKFQLKVSHYVCYIIRERHCTKIIVSRLLKLTVSYLEVYSYRCISMDTQTLSKFYNFFRTRFVKKPYTSWEVDLLDSVVTLNIYVQYFP